MTPQANKLLIATLALPRHRKVACQLPVPEVQPKMFLWQLTRWLLPLTKFATDDQDDVIQLQLDAWHCVELDNNADRSLRALVIQAICQNQPQLRYSKPKPAEADVQALAQTILLKLFNTTEKLAKGITFLRTKKRMDTSTHCHWPQRHRPTHDRRDRLFHDLWTRCRRSSLCLWRTSHPKASTSRATL